ncbi:Leucine-rich repeat receptor-like protein kinase PXL1 [Striga hermonthica]|uniref:Leucine-rich repeat receptor-like protein kinase PXL1 n=1 Tax=Striga hermonthica TaxID=68872 RepID=A0A9N7RA85_STRHE|nr:Leucine-rich repeat receptor-like protein kinase PXL1 [Striga hermonthica]
MSSIKEIWVKSNHLTGMLPSDMCDNVSTLEVLALRDNQLEGSIPPNIGECRALRILWISLNRFSGEIPSEIARLSMLEELYLGANEFKGGISREIGKLSRLQILDISRC